MRLLILLMSLNVGLPAFGLQRACPRIFFAPTKSEYKQVEAEKLGLNPSSPDDFVPPAALKSRRELKRIESLKIPRTFKDIRINPDSNGTIQAIGTAKSGKVQYFYHPRWNLVRDKIKFEMLKNFGAALSSLRSIVEKDLRSKKMDKRTLSALIVRLLDKTAIRIGNEESSNLNETFGLTTLQKSHVKVGSSVVSFEFIGKSNKLHFREVTDRLIIEKIRELYKLDGSDLFVFENEEGGLQRIGAADINEYLKENTDSDLSAKDFRTWHGSLAAVRFYRDSLAGEQKADIEMGAAKAAAQVLGNSPAVARESYIDPKIFKVFGEPGKFQAFIKKAQNKLRKANTGLSLDEEILMAILTDP